MVISIFLSIFAPELKRTVARFFRLRGTTSARIVQGLGTLAYVIVVLVIGKRKNVRKYTAETNVGCLIMIQSTKV